LNNKTSGQGFSTEWSDFCMCKRDLIFMRKQLQIVILLAFMLVPAGCKKNFVISDKQRVLFQYEFTNYAWTDDHSGFLIDNEGNVLQYNNPEVWHFFPDEDLIINSAEIDENIASCTNSGIVIPAGELLRFSACIDNIAASRISAVKNTAADAGTSQFICYQFSEGTGDYKGTLIKMEGDFSCENLNFYSKKVTSWMKDIRDRISGR